MKSTFLPAWSKKAKFMPAVGWIALYLLTTLFVYSAPLCKHNSCKTDCVFRTITRLRSPSVTFKVAPFFFRRCAMNSFDHPICDVTKGCADVTAGCRFPPQEAAWFLSSFKSETGGKMSHLQMESETLVQVCWKLIWSTHPKNAFKGKFAAMSWCGPLVEQSVSTMQMWCKYKETKAKAKRRKKKQFMRTTA